MHPLQTSSAARSASHWLAAAILGLASTMASGAQPAPAAAPWVEGQHYFRLAQVQPTTVPAGKVEVLEVFSYGCPACNSFAPLMQRLKLALPPQAAVTYLPASWNTAENWPMLQRAYLTAVSLGVAERTHDAMYAAVWKTGELGITDGTTQRLKTKLPTIEDAARFYQRSAGIAPDRFIATAKSFAVEMAMRQADQKIKAMQIPSTPNIVVAGKYRVDGQSAGGFSEMVALVQWLVAREAKAPR